MYECDSKNKKYFNETMNSLKKENDEYKSLINSKPFKFAKSIEIVRKSIKEKNFQLVKKYLVNLIMNRRADMKFRGKFSTNVDITEVEGANYFSNDRIAIYTCVFGSYDKIADPIFVPDNCDFYIISDQLCRENKIWIKYDYSKFNDNIQNYSNVEKNRFFKMQPHLLFPNYKYSIYLDGNIQPITDLTEFVNKIGTYGIAAHKHSLRNCVYDEAEILSFLKKDTKENIEKHINFLKCENFPIQYGLVECNVIAREHNLEICKKVMDDWWHEFLFRSKRDQLSFPYVLYKNNIKVNDICTLGNNVFQNMAIRKRGHN